MGQDCAQSVAGSGCSASGREGSDDCPVAGGGLERDCAEVGEESVTVHGGWSDPDVARTPAVIAMVGMDTLPMGNDVRLDCADGCPAWDGGCQRKMVDGVTVLRW